MRKSPGPRYLVVIMGLLWTLIVLHRPLPAGSNRYEEFFDQNLFHDRVKLLNSLPLGTPQGEVLKMLGAPGLRETDPEGHQVLIYRVRCYIGPEPAGPWPRHLSLTYEKRFVFDRNDRLISTQSKP